MFGLWLLMSGLFKPLLITFGLASSVLTVWIAYCLKLIDGSLVSKSGLRIMAMIRYVFWLIVEIGKADWAVTKAILASPEGLRQRLIKVPAGQKSDLTRALFANSITITPGTVCVETEVDHFVVHALDDATADKEALADMERRVSALEREQR
ncbi:Na+/H+ antiporter subunit E [Pseudahrensia aquimaris]|uniref:Na+/H+ antiporter subunit E n=1 Tax=Pseudahrensia aquimaris TaxID=744461 RepID=A0ABW3FEL0_9HYPH